MADLYLKIAKHTSQEHIEPGKLLRLFENGSCIIVTLHHYLKETDDCGRLSIFYCFLMCFIKNTAIFIDQGHLFFNDISPRLPLSETWYLKEGQWNFVNNVAFLNSCKTLDAKNFKKRGLRFS